MGGISGGGPSIIDQLSSAAAQSRSGTGQPTGAAAFNTASLFDDFLPPQTQQHDGAAVSSSHARQENQDNNPDGDNSGAGSSLTHNAGNDASGANVIPNNMFD